MRRKRKLKLPRIVAELLLSADPMGCFLFQEDPGDSDGNCSVHGSGTVLAVRSPLIHPWM